MTKNKKILVPVLSALATAAVTVPTLATTVSCAKDKFAGESVLDGLYEPSDIEPYRTAGNLNFPQAETAYFNYISQHLDAPAKEFKWMGAGLPSLVKDLNTFIRSRYMSKDTDYDPITLTKLNVQMSNFTLNDVDKHTASYRVVQDIEMVVHFEVPEESPNNELTFRHIDGTIRLAWCNDVNNMPIGLFDLGTDDLKIFDPTSNDLPFPDKTLWYFAPDMSQVSYNDNSWSMNLDYLLDVNVVVNQGVEDEDKVIDFNDELKFTFDKWACFGIEKYFEMTGYRKDLLPNLIERILPLTCGWDSYYLSQSTHADHINGNLEGYGWNEDCILYQFDVYTDVEVSAEAPATYRYALGEPGISKDDIQVVLYGITDFFDPETESILDLGYEKVWEVTPQWDITDNGSTLEVSYDWSSQFIEQMGYQRPEGGASTFAGQPYGRYDFVVPVVLTKDWFALGRAFNIWEKSVEIIWNDDVPCVINEGSSYHLESCIYSPEINKHIGEYSIVGVDPETGVESPFVSKDPAETYMEANSDGQTINLNIRASRDSGTPVPIEIKILNKNQETVFSHCFRVIDDAPIYGNIWNPSANKTITFNPADGSFSIINALRLPVDVFGKDMAGHWYWGGMFGDKCKILNFDISADWISYTQENEYLYASINVPGCPALVGSAGLESVHFEFNLGDQNWNTKYCTIENLTFIPQ